MNQQTASQKQAYLTVSEVTRLLNYTLESKLPSLSFEGEISQCTRAASGHIYYTVKDQDSQISCVMWRGMAQGLDFEPDQGLAVLCHGKPNVYNKNGRLQIVVTKMIPAGEGLLQQKFLQLKAKLEAEGFFAEERKRELPFLPKTIGLVTSGSGAALQDMLVKIRERMPSTKLVLADARVQGQGAAEEIADRIKLLNQRSDIDLIIAGRGGGSLEDLWAFNEEIVVKAVFGSRIPIICAVGHEVDESLAELAADRRAPTPTAAAELAVPHRDELTRRISELSRRLADTDRWFQLFVQDFDDLTGRLEDALEGMFDKARSNLDRMDSMVKLLHPKRLLENARSKIELLFQKIVSASSKNIQTAKARLDRTASVLDSVSPTRVLSRGFSVVTSQEGLVSSSAKLKEGDELSIRFYKGSAESVVKKISK